MTSPAKKNVSCEPCIDDFVIIKPISKGSFGKVFLGYRKGMPSTLYAIKAMKKGDLLRKNMAETVLKERTAFCVTSTQSFCVRLFYSLQTKNYVYLIMEWCIGGDLKSLLTQMGYFNLPMASFYVAQIAIAIDFLHRNGIVHRDIKPDNLLLDRHGYIKLTDFGLSRVDTSQEFKPSVLTNFTPSQLASLQMRFSFNPSPSSMSLAESPTEEVKQRISSFEGPDSQFYGASTPLCSFDDLSSDSTTSSMNRKMRKPVRRFSLPLIDKACATQLNTSPQSSHYRENNITDWSVIQTPEPPKEKRARLTENDSSYINLTYTDSEFTPDKQNGKGGSLDICQIKYFERKEFQHSSPLTSETTDLKHPNELHLNTCTVTPNSNVTGRSHNQSEIPGMHSKGMGFQDISPISEIRHLDSQIIYSPEFARRDHTRLYVSQRSQLLSPVSKHRNADSHNHSMNKRDIENTNVSDTNWCIPRIKRKRFDEIPPTSTHSTGLSINMTQMKIKSGNFCASNYSDHDDVKSASINSINSSNKKILGTPDYLAPELIRQTGHGPAVDWWSLGVCFYEFLIGILPFSDVSPEKIFAHIVNRTLEFPDDMHLPSKICIECLLELNPQKRGNLETLKNEKFAEVFRGIDWNDMHNTTPPFVPKPDSPGDTKYYEARNIEMDINVSDITTP